jgi:uncharacterized membrane protein YeaQ/YmgE (transglycosylase-associated protein family)
MFDFATIFMYIVVGAGSGLVASVFIKGARLGFVGDALVGVLGAFAGGFFMKAIGHEAFTGYNFWSFIVSFLGAVVILTLVRIIRSGELARVDSQ